MAGEEAETKTVASNGFSVLQAVALILGVGGMFVDFYFDIYGDEHLPVMIYAMLIGFAFGMDKLKSVIDSAKK